MTIDPEFVSRHLEALESGASNSSTDIAALCRVSFDIIRDFQAKYERLEKALVDKTAGAPAARLLPVAREIDPRDAELAAWRGVAAAEHDFMRTTPYDAESAKKSAELRFQLALKACKPFKDAAIKMHREASKTRT